MSSDKSAKRIALEYGAPQRPGVVGAVVKSLPTPPGLLMHIVSTALFALTMWDGVAPGGTWGILGVLLLFIWLLLLLVWPIRMLFFALASKPSSKPLGRAWYVWRTLGD